jgi:hypothetical protein
MRPDDELKKVVETSTNLLTRAIELFNDYDADEVMYVISWLMGIHVHYVVDRELMTEDKALDTVLSLVRTAYIAQGEDDND